MELADGEVFDLRIGPVAKRLGDTTVRMLGYNGSIPGPTLKVRQGSEIVVQVVNRGDLEATVGWRPGQPRSLSTRAANRPVGRSVDPKTLAGGSS